jgi:hypothetical protein
VLTSTKGSMEPVKNSDTRDDIAVAPAERVDRA